MSGPPLWLCEATLLTFPEPFIFPGRENGAYKAVLWHQNSASCIGNSENKDGGGR